MERVIYKARRARLCLKTRCCGLFWSSSFNCFPTGTGVSLSTGLYLYQPFVFATQLPPRSEQIIMDTVPPYPQSEPSNDIFSLSDDVLSECLEFIYEVCVSQTMECQILKHLIQIGFGNWGSVWLCRPRPAKTSDGKVRPLGQKIAVKVVHRSKTSTTAARVRSL